MITVGYHAWLADHLAGTDSLLIASGNDQAAEMSGRARAGLLDSDPDRAAAEAGAEMKRPGPREPSPLCLKYCYMSISVMSGGTLKTGRRLASVFSVS